MLTPTLPHAIEFSQTGNTRLRAVICAEGVIVEIFNGLDAMGSERWREVEENRLVNDVGQAIFAEWKRWVPSVADE